MTSRTGGQDHHDSKSDDFDGENGPEDLGKWKRGQIPIEHDPASFIG
jgi:hypothetical protein